MAKVFGVEFSDWEQCQSDCCDAGERLHLHGSKENYERWVTAVEHFVDPDAGAYGHEDRDTCREVLLNG